MFAASTLNRFYMISVLGGSALFSLFGVRTLTFVSDGEWRGEKTTRRLISYLLAVWLGHLAEQSQSIN